MTRSQGRPLGTTSSPQASETAAGSVEGPDPSGIGHEVAERFELGAVRSFTAAGEGAMGRIWRLTTDTDDVAVKQTFWALDADVQDRLATREVAFIELARSAGVLAPRQRADRTGRFAVATSIGVVRVADWVDGRPVGTDDAGAAWWAGRVLAVLTGLEFPVESAEVDPWFTTAPTEEQWAGTVAAARTAGADWADDLSAAVPSLLSLGSRLGADRPLRVAWSHTDIQAQNLVRRADGSYELIDWDDASPVVPVYALARLLFDWCLTPVADGAPTIDVALVATVVDGYRAGGGVELPTAGADYDGLIAGTLNFLAWQASLALGLDPEQGAAQPPDGPAHRQVRRLLAEPLRLETVDALARTVAAGSP